LRIARKTASVFRIVASSTPLFRSCDTHASIASGARRPARFYGRASFDALGDGVGGFRRCGFQGPRRRLMGAGALRNDEPISRALAPAIAGAAVPMAARPAHEAVRSATP
jgi:hypothetical protein